MPQPETQPRSRRNLVIGVPVALLIATALVWTTLASHSNRRLISGEEVARAPVFEAEWLKLPTPDDVETVYPERARQEALKDKVLVDMRCIIGAEGDLQACAIFSESLPGYGFGEAGLKLADRFEVKTLSPEGLSLVGLRITVPLGFDPIYAPEPAPKSPPIA